MLVAVVSIGFLLFALALMAVCAIGLLAVVTRIEAGLCFSGAAASPLRLAVLGMYNTNAARSRGVLYDQNTFFRRARSLRTALIPRGNGPSLCGDARPSEPA